MVLLRRFEDRTAEALSCSGQAVQKVRLDFGWEGALVGEGIEGVEMEWNALCYDITVSCSDAVALPLSVTTAVIQYVCEHILYDCQISTLTVMPNCTSCHSWVPATVFQIVLNST